MNRVPNLQSAFDSQAAKRRDVLQRSASGRAIDVPGIAQAVLRRNRLKRGFGVVKDDAGGMGGLALAYAVLLEQGYVDAGCGKDVRRGATNRASPDNGDIGLERPAELWIGGPPGRRKRVGPKHGPVVRFGQDWTILVHVFRIDGECPLKCGFRAARDREEPVCGGYPTDSPPSTRLCARRGGTE